MKLFRLCLVGFVFFLLAGAVFAAPLRVGLEIGNPTAVIIIRPTPLDFKVGYDFTGVGSGGDNFFHVSGDYRIIDSYHLIDFLSLFLGAGAYVQIVTGGGDGDNFLFGARLPVGVQAFLVNNTVEIFLEVAPTVKFIPAIVAFDDWQGFIGFTIAIPR